MGDTFLRGSQLLFLNSLSVRGGILIIRVIVSGRKIHLFISSQICSNDDKKNLSGDDPEAPYLIYSSYNYGSITVMSEK